jgi:hypothetical protein
MRDALAVTCGDVSRHVTDVWTFCRICASTVSSMHFGHRQGQDSGIRPYCTRFRVVSGNADRDIVVDLPGPRDVLLLIILFSCSSHATGRSRKYTYR